MLKTLLLTTLTLAILTLAACQTTSTPSTTTTAAPKGTPLGDTGIRVSGTLETGASTTAR